MGHVVSEQAEAILDRKFPVLDKGFVRLVDYLGGDSRIVAAARVSYGAAAKAESDDRRLIDYLMRHQHTSPFEQVILTFHVKLPIFVARQWIRHRTARLNEISGRYSVLESEFYLPDRSAVRFQSTLNKQGRSEEEVPPELARRVIDILGRDQGTLYASYEEMLSCNVARELARINLPLSTYTQWYWQIDLHNLFHFLRLRIDRHAQYEIRAYAEVMGEITKKVAPMACEAFEEHVLFGGNLSRSEIAVVLAVMKGTPPPQLTGSQTLELAAKLGIGLEEFTALLRR